MRRLELLGFDLLAIGGFGGVLLLCASYLRVPCPVLDREATSVHKAVSDTDGGQRDEYRTLDVAVRRLVRSPTSR
jgi:hypothetical protein